MKYQLSYETSRYDGAGSRNIHGSVDYHDIVNIISYNLRRGFVIHHLTITRA